MKMKVFNKAKKNFKNQQISRNLNDILGNNSSNIKNSELNN